MPPGFRPTAASIMAIWDPYFAIGETKQTAVSGQRSEIHQDHSF